ncbi:MAG: methylated-DNA--[protein]-cysteine S-methyltransferase [Puniceicoccales bacterium]|jgi:methylated-DNA-[protein]-cysteine S-methyltransferase|nr:methylated-DNA--[protein]-cysteine S-methyltransferase [Puniceicoccales bacterium]
MKQNAIFHETNIGPLTITAENDHIIGIDFGVISPANHVNIPVIHEAFRQLSEYFTGKRKIFNLPLNLSGTNFQKSAWEALLKIPYGQTITYGDIARMMCKRKAYRAVGMACHGNPISIVIPCHRIIGARGNLTGYGGGIDIKAWLLELEAKHTHGLQI